MNQQCAILFDLDGTLVDLSPEESELELLRTRIITHARLLGVSRNNTSIFDTYQFVLEQYGFEHSTAKAMRLDLDAFEVQCAMHHASSNCDPTNITELRDLGLCVGIVTSNGSACLNALFEKNILAKEWFDLIITRDDCSLLKPSPNPIKLAVDFARRIRPNLTELWFVGDSLRDQQAVDHYNRSASTRISYIKVAAGCHIREENADNKIDDVLENLLIRFRG